MNYELKKAGFSLTEVLLAVGTLAIGLIFIGGTFIAGIHFSTIATERTIAAIAADEAFAKVKIFGVVDFNSPPWPASTTMCVDFNNVSGIRPTDPNEFAYPSTRTALDEKQYFWSALCRRVDPNDRCVQVTVFVSRKVGSGTRYWGRNPYNWPELIEVLYPRPVVVSVARDLSNPYKLSIIDLNPSDGINEAPFINDGYTIVENTTGQIYRVVERPASQPETIVLDRPWGGGNSVWVVPPPVGSGRRPCIAVYQEVIRF
jgi:hypothetical protein